MISDALLSFEESFQAIDDPRVVPRCTHSLHTLLFIAVASTIAGADGPEDMAKFAKRKAQWLKRFVDLEDGVPSHDTLGRVLSAIQPRPQLLSRIGRTPTSLVHSPAYVIQREIPSSCPLMARRCVARIPRPTNQTCCTSSVPGRRRNQCLGIGARNHLGPSRRGFQVERDYGDSSVTRDVGVAWSDCFDPGAPGWVANERLPPRLFLATVTMCCKSKVINRRYREQSKVRSPRLTKQKPRRQKLAGARRKKSRVVAKKCGTTRSYHSLIRCLRLGKSGLA